MHFNQIFTLWKKYLPLFLRWQLLSQDLLKLRTCRVKPWSMKPLNKWFSPVWKNVTMPTSQLLLTEVLLKLLVRPKWATLFMTGRPMPLQETSLPLGLMVMQLYALHKQLMHHVQIVVQVLPFGTQLSVNGSTQKHALKVWEPVSVPSLVTKRTALSSLPTLQMIAESLSLKTSAKAPAISVKVLFFLPKVTMVEFRILAGQAFSAQVKTSTLSTLSTLNTVWQLLTKKPFSTPVIRMANSSWRTTSFLIWMRTTYQPVVRTLVISWPTILKSPTAFHSCWTTPGAMVKLWFQKTMVKTGQIEYSSNTLVSMRPLLNHSSILVGSALNLMLMTTSIWFTNTMAQPVNLDQVLTTLLLVVSVTGVKFFPRTNCALVASVMLDNHLFWTQLT